MPDYLFDQLPHSRVESWNILRTIQYQLNLDYMPSRSDFQVDGVNKSRLEFQSELTQAQLDKLNQIAEYFRAQGNCDPSGLHSDWTVYSIKDLDEHRQELEQILGREVRIFYLRSGPETGVDTIKMFIAPPPLSVQERKAVKNWYEGLIAEL
ncbi:MAG: hypothetical protein JRI59_06015 [Deltaproteobacteria bacterium]|nr:hypothetical protein [Deltaproteobacteria bacterium]